MREASLSPQAQAFPALKSGLAERVPRANTQRGGAAALPPATIVDGVPERPSHLTRIRSVPGAPGALDEARRAGDEEGRIVA
jgi:hypothetical protein